jgi:hypothetical protein
MGTPFWKRELRNFLKKDVVPQGRLDARFDTVKDRFDLTGTEKVRNRSVVRRHTRTVEDRYDTAETETEKRAEHKISRTSRAIGIGVVIVGAASIGSLLSLSSSTSPVSPPGPTVATPSAVGVATSRSNTGGGGDPATHVPPGRKHHKTHPSSSVVTQPAFTNPKPVSSASPSRTAPATAASSASPTPTQSGSPTSTQSSTATPTASSTPSPSESAISSAPPPVPVTPQIHEAFLSQ